MTLEANDKHAITSIIRAAEMNILLQTGINLKLEWVAAKPIMEDVQVMMGVIAKSLGMTMDDYFGNRSRANVDLRTITVLFIRENYPSMILKDIGRHIGGLDHTTVIHMQNRGLDYLKTKEETFCEKYNKAVIAVERWVKTITNGKKD